MKAVQINAYGGVDVLEVNANAPKPSVGKGQVLVEVHAVGVTPFDWKLRAGYVKDKMPLTFPTTLGGDFAGVILEVGEEVTDSNVGDEVYGSALIFNGGSGSFAEFAAVNTANVALKPKTVSFEEAGAFPLVGASAVQALEEHLKLQKAQKILIHGGAGGIGHIAIQLAKAHGAYVATTASSADEEFVKNLGADEVIDYKKQHFEALLKDYDAVFDTVGVDITNKSFKVIKKAVPAGRQGGVLVTMSGQPSQSLAKEYGITAIRQGTKTNALHLKQLAELIDAGKIKVNIDKIFSIDQVKEAFKHLEEGHPRGKVVLKIKN